MHRLFQDVHQGNVIDNYNRLVELAHAEGLLLDMPELDDEGICNEETFGYIIHAEQGERVPYVAAMMFFAKLNTDTAIKELIDKIKEAKSKGINVTIPYGKNNSLSFNKALEIVQGIYAGAKDQSLLQIGAMWDKTYTMVCKTKDLADRLKALKIKDGQKIYMGTGDHSFFIEKTKDGYYLFEPNKGGQHAISPIIKTETQLSILIGMSQRDWIVQNYQVSKLDKANKAGANRNIDYAKAVDNIGLTFQYISFGRKSNRALDDAVEAAGDELKNEDIINHYILQYSKRQMSRLDAALSIHELLKNRQNLSPVMKKFKRDIEKYLKREQPFIDLQFKKSDLDDRAYSDTMITPLYLAIQMNQVKLVKHYIKLGVDVNAVMADGSTALDYAKEHNQQEIVALLSSHLSNPISPPKFA